jgi:pyruvate ferredoxin oxidoreductase gamma subunit
LLQGALLAAAGSETLIVVNSARSAAEFRETLPGYRVVPVDGLAISRRNGLGRIVNSALLGGLACAVGDPSLRVLEELLLEESPKLREANVAACTEGWLAVEMQLQEAS